VTGGGKKCGPSKSGQESVSKNSDQKQKGGLDVI
jgi:hypothetical protein